ncbi:uncharacterized protein LOC112268926 [Brachypodium distachyon]|nr:uncharacterized protein LOC112268926 [Brachypodium distachyon]|eukprot:XP_024310970.1 uncharacterized protein LOC112268926 [Brachypodium distachyon]
MQFAIALPEEIRGNDDRFERRALHVIAQAATKFRSSLEIALFKARLLYQLNEIEAARAECIRALGITKPDDPAEQQVLLRSSPPQNRSTIASLKQELATLLEHMSPAAIEGDSEPQASDLALSDHMIETSEEFATPRVKLPHSLSYGHRVLHKPDRILEIEKHIPPRQPPPPAPPIHFVAGQVVPQEIVNIFVLHCQARLTCGENMTVCHLCSFDGVADRKVKVLSR